MKTDGEREELGDVAWAVALRTDPDEAELYTEIAAAVAVVVRKRDGALVERLQTMIEGYSKRAIEAENEIDNLKQAVGNRSRWYIDEHEENKRMRAAIREVVALCDAWVDGPIRAMQISHLLRPFVDIDE